MVVVGGGITGVGAALDLATRGFEVALVEQADFAQGTSSRSTKLLHGGIRYLAHFDFGLVSESLREQKVLARIADFLYRPLEFVIPIYRQFGLADAPAWAARGWRAPLALRAGLTLYDALGGWGRPGARHRRVPVDRLTEWIPMIRRQGLVGGFAYSDAQTDDARLVITVAKTAVRRYGVTAVGRVRVDRLSQSGPGFAVALEDAESGDRFEVQTRAVLAATGAFPPPEGPCESLRLVRSKGAHLVVTRKQLDTGERALVLPETDDGRVLFVIPWLGHSLIGTTDTYFSEDPTHPQVTDEDAEYLLSHVGRYLDADGLAPIASFAGIRALADTGQVDTGAITREHLIDQPIPGYVRVAGGKLTTYRRIAAQASDLVAKTLGGSGRSVTDEIPLVGAGGAVVALAERLAAVGVDAPLMARYGTETEQIARLVEEDSGGAVPLGDGVVAEVVYAVRYEAATRIADFTLRRNHLAWFTPDHGRAAAPTIAGVMAAELGWDAARIETALAEHEQELRAEGL